MSELKQKYFIGDKIKIMLEGTISEVYIGYDRENHTDILRYKITSNNKSNEYYLTDIVGLMQEANIPIGYYCLPKDQQYEINNVNTKKDLDSLHKLIDKLFN